MSSFTPQQGKKLVRNRSHDSRGTRKQAAKLFQRTEEKVNGKGIKVWTLW